MDAASVSRALSAVACACSKLTTRLLSGLTLKSLTMMRMDATALLKSRLTSASAVECVTVAKARPTSPSPAVKVGDKTHDRNKRQKNDAGADGERGEHASQPVERKR